MWSLYSGSTPSGKVNIVTTYSKDQSKNELYTEIKKN